MSVAPRPESGYAAVLDSPIGHLGLALSAERLTGIDFLPVQIPLRAPRTAAAARVADRLQAYFADPAAGLDLPVRDVGTPFQLRVWALLRTIPVGTTRTYGELAASLNSSPRAVGGACRANPIPLVTPCHRVVAAGDLGGFAGDRRGGQTRIKEWLLRHEGALTSGT